MAATSTFDPARRVRRRITLWLAVAGAAAGAVVGLALTVLGKIVAGAPPATLANYAWNAAVFGTIGALLVPTVTWAGLRRVPLWRAVLEPLAAAVAGAGIGVLLGSGLLFLVLVPVAATAAVARLAHAYRDPALPAPRGD